MAWTSPKTWAANSAATSADQNTYVRDNTAYLYGDGSGGGASWTNATLLNSWVAFGSSRNPPSYRLSGPNVQLRGSMKSGTTTGGTTLFTLPGAYSPAAPLVLVLNSNGAFATCQVAVNGNVTVFGGTWSASEVSFDGCNFTTQ